MTTLYTNYNYDEYMDEAREYLKQQMEEYGEEGEPSEEEVYNEAVNINEGVWEFYKQALENYLKEYNLIAIGTVGTWQGPAEGGLVVESIRDLYKLLTDCDYIELSMDTKQMYIKCSHHDGTNYFQLRELLESDYEYYLENNYDMDRREMCEYLFPKGVKPQLAAFL